MKRFSWLFIVDFVYLISAQYGQYIELSPCPSNFEYATDGNSVYGIIHLWPDGPLRVLFLRANFTISGRLNSMESNLQPIGSDVLQDYNRGKRISFRVIFPRSSSLPMLTALTVNDRTICVGPGDRPSPTNYVTTITLQNLLYLKPNGVSGFSSLYQPNFQATKPTEKYEIISIHKLNNTDLINIPNDSSFTNKPQKPEVIIYENEDQFIQSVLNQQINPTQKVPVQQNRPTTQKTPTFEFELIPIYQNPNKVTTQRIPQDKNEGIPQYNPPKPQYRPEYPDEQIPATPTTTKAPQTTAAPVVVDRIPDITTKRPSELSNNIQCGISASDNTRVPLIYNGESFERGDWPWLVAMYKRKDGGLSFICSGTLVSDRHVITAAHCMRTKTTLLRIKDIVVKVGVYNLEDWGDDEFITRTLASATIHESYNASTLANDILIITFDRRVQFSNSIRPACLWTGSSDLNKVVGTAGVVTGWGQSELGGAGRGEPRMVRMPIVSTAKCRASKPDFHKLTSAYTLCAGDRNGAGPCLGDSGAGLYLRDSGLWRLRGIVSLSLRAETGDSSCNLNEYIVFTDAAQYLAWIQYIMNT